MSSSRLAGETRHGSSASSCLESASTEMRRDSSSVSSLCSHIPVATCLERTKHPCQGVGVVGRVAWGSERGAERARSLRGCLRIKSGCVGQRARGAAAPEKEEFIERNRLLARAVQRHQLPQR
eukprot:4980833-Prymnesium_polylepis.1